jgi:hypothetical protein
VDKTLRKFASHEEMRAETYRYWHGRPDSDIFEAIWEMSAEAYRWYYRLRGIVHDEAGAARSLISHSTNNRLIDVPEAFKA